MTSSGPSGEVRWGYLTAAVFGPWHAELSRSGGTLTARVVSVDAFRRTQAPLSLVLPGGRSPASWPILTLQIEGASLTATVGPRSTP